MLLAALAACDSGVKFANEPPRSLSISKNKCVTWPGGAVMLTGAAVDDDGDPLSFRWGASAGSFDPADGRGAVVAWIAPDEPGAYTITMKVTDDIEERSTTTEIEVAEEFPGFIFGETTITDNGQRYILRNELPINIPVGATLTLEAGVQIVVDSEFGGFNVLGALVVNGTVDREVVIGPNICVGTTATWKGIFFSGQPSSGECRHFASISSLDGIHVTTMAQATFDTCRIEGHDNNGILVADNSRVTIRGCKIWDNEVGVSIENANATVESSSVRYNSDYSFFITVAEGSTTTFDIAIEDCTIASNQEDGIYLTGEAKPEIHNCSFFSNGAVTGNYYHLRLEYYTGPDSIQAQNNYWGKQTLDPEEIADEIRDARNSADVEAFVDFTPWLNSMPPHAW
jgi:parallel beta-helix repeat protein